MARDLDPRSPSDTPRHDLSRDASEVGPRMLEYATPQATGPVRLGWWLLLIAQVPAIIGGTCISSVLAGWVKGDPYGATFGVAFMTSVGGSLISLLATICLGRKRYGAAWYIAVGVHIVYLVIWAALVASVITHEALHPTVRHGGGF